MLVVLISFSSRELTAHVKKSKISKQDWLLAVEVCFVFTILFVSDWSMIFCQWMVHEC
jgi:hypothetical protein